ncbi:hypothetical protein BH23CHL2_BH23CHL2_12130 [soil metagenome]
MYEREVSGEPVEFGVSGQLYNSDLLMYDRKTDSLWEQVSGVAVVGEQAGDRLAYYPSQIMTWGQWQETYPKSEVLSRYTGYQRDYEGKPYVSYFERDELWFGVNALSTQLFAKEYVAGIELPGSRFVAYLERDVVEHSVLNDTVDGVPLLIAAEPKSGTIAAVFDRRVDGRELTFGLDGGMMVDQETGSRWTLAGTAVEGEMTGAQLEPIRSLRLFWFAWVAFHPETELRTPEG